MRRTVMIGAVTVCLVGCQAPDGNGEQERVHEALHATELRGTFAHMTDNALLEDMTISDMHYMPHRGLLTTLGKQRLSRLASLLMSYGGQVRFSSNLPEGPLASARLDNAVAFLRDAGVDMDADTVVRDLPGGDGISASEALLIRKHEGTYQEGDGTAINPDGAKSSGGGD